MDDFEESLGGSYHHNRSNLSQANGGPVSTGSASIRPVTRGFNTPSNEGGSQNRDEVVAVVSHIGNGSAGISYPTSMAVTASSILPSGGQQGQQGGRQIQSGMGSRDRDRYNQGAEVAFPRDQGASRENVSRESSNKDLRDRDREQRRLNRTSSREKDDNNGKVLATKDKQLIQNALPNIFKVAVVGDSTVGKSTICQAVTSDSYQFNKNYHLTCGVAVYTKTIKLPEPVEGQEDRVNVVLLDSSGKDIYMEYLPKYWDSLSGVALVIDLSSKSSVQNASQWLDLTKSVLNPSSSAPLGVLIGNKMDLSDRRQVSPKAAQDLAAKHNLQYFECSVKENCGLEEPFFYLAHQWVVGRHLAGQGQSSRSNKENYNE